MKDPSPIGDDSDSVVLKKVGYESFVLCRQFDMNLDNLYMNDYQGGKSSSKGQEEGPGVSEVYQEVVW